MGSAHDSALDKISKAQASFSGNHITHGKYNFLVKKMSLEEKRKDTFFIVELLTMSSVQLLPTITPNPVGSTYSFMCGMDSDVGPNNAKRFILELLGQNPAEFEDTDANRAELRKTMGIFISPGNPGRGMRIDAETVHKEKDKKKGEFGTYPQWAACAKLNTKALVSARQALVDVGNFDGAIALALEQQKAALAIG